ncbi:MAG: adenylate/guanylate cyclase domain-containing protein [Acidimicrobiia bacterium]|nr:adenylate/guanylate cyclase domain-containing protein [Acidimicrobiia bacterium]
MFPVPSRAGLQSRVGIHAGEVQLRGGDVSGIVVNIAARVCALAGPAEVLVTRTVKDLLAGSTNLRFTDRGAHELKGIADPWQLYSVD